MAQKNPYIFDNSPVEFILFGPFGGRDVVLVQSKSPGLDLFGLVNHRFEHLKDKPSGEILSALLTGKQRKLNAVNSERSIDVIRDQDDRYSSYRFIWVGLASSTDKRIFRYEFNDSIPAIVQALTDDDDAALKVLIGGLVLQCTNFDEKRILSRRTMRLVLILYLFGVFSFIYFWVRNH